jgi:exopolyphosphatase / guanosine-5'-triphosphate,3'-diphosphate pyrophosphatase
MAEIVPRWEWRTFGDSFGDADARFAALDAGDVQESDEIYFLSPANDANVKVRDKLMDIKTLQQVNADGLEQWKPVMKGTFPLKSRDVVRVFDLLGIECPTLGRGSYALDGFIEQLANPDPQLRVVNVHKKRAHYTIDGCMAEMADVVIDGRKTRTVALELEDPARVITTVRDLELDRFPNISYPRGLKQLVGMKS